MDLTGIGSIAKAADSIISKFFPDKTEQERGKLALEMQEIMNEHNLISGQIEVNKIEAQNANWFVSGWRPYVGWVCGTGLLYQLLLMPIVNGIFAAFGASQPFPSLDIQTLVTVLTGMLGLAGMRSFEKKNNVHRN